MNPAALENIISQPVPDKPPRPTSERNFEHLFETLASDMQWAALHAGILTAVIGAKLRTDASWGLRPWCHLLNTDTRVALLGLRYAPDMHLADGQVHSAVQFYSAFTDAIAVSLPVFTGRQSFGNAKRNLPPLLHQWQGTCLLASKALSAFAPVVRQRLHKCYAANCELTIAFVESAGREINDLVNANGEVTFPSLTQRRRTVRIPTRQSCVVVHSGGETPAEITDVSRTGIGLNCDQLLPTEQSVTIELTDGRRLQANIIWQQNGRIGLEFVSSLKHNDPLLPVI